MIKFDIGKLIRNFTMTMHLELYSNFKESSKTGFWTYKLVDDFCCQSDIMGHTFSSKWLKVFPDGRIFIPKDYAWDGCTPKFLILKAFVFGTFDGPSGKDGLPKAYHASLVHDALYQFYVWHDIDRNIIDMLFYKMLALNEFKNAKLYYNFVDILGRYFVGKKHLYYDKFEWDMEFNYRPVEKLFKYPGES